MEMIKNPPEQKDAARGRIGSDIVNLPKELYFTIISYASRDDIRNLCKIDYFRDLILNNPRDLFYISFPRINVNEIITVKWNFKNIAYILEIYNTIKIQYIDDRIENYFNNTKIERTSQWQFFNFNIIDNPIIYKYLQRYVDTVGIDILDIFLIGTYGDYYLEYHSTSNTFTLNIFYSHDRRRQIISMELQDAIHLLIYIKLIDPRI